MVATLDCRPFVDEAVKRLGLTFDEGLVLAAEFAPLPGLLDELAAGGESLSIDNALRLARASESYTSKLRDAVTNFPASVFDLGRALAAMGDATCTVDALWNVPEVQVSDEWLHLTQAMTGRTYSYHDLTETLLAGDPLIEQTWTDRGPVARPRDAVSRTILLGGVPISESEHVQLFNFLCGRTRASRHSKDASDFFLSEQLVYQAAASGALERLLQDGELLVLAEPTALTRLLERCAELQMDRTAQAYLQSAHHMRESSFEMRAAYLSLGAAKAGARSVLDTLSVAYPVLPWRAEWSRGGTLHPNRTLVSLEAPALSLDIAGEGEAAMIVSGHADGTVAVSRLYDAEITTVRTGEAGEVRGVRARLVDGELFVAAVKSDHSVVVGNPQRGPLLSSETDAHTAPLSAVEIVEHDESTVVYAAGVDGRITAWDGATAALVDDALFLHPVEIRAMRTVTTADGDLLLVAGSVDGHIVTLDLATRTPRVDVATGVGVVNALDAESVDGTIRVVTGGIGGTLAVFDLGADGRIVTKVVEVNVGSSIQSVGLVGDGDNRLVLAGGGNQTWTCHRLPDLTVVVRESRGHFGTVCGTRAISLPPDQVLPVTCAADGTVRSWNLEACATANQRLGRPQSNAGDVTSVRLGVSASGGRTVVTGHTDGGIRIWQEGAGHGVAHIRTHYDTVQSLLVHPLDDGGQLVLSGSADGTIWMHHITAAGEVTSDVVATAHDGVTCLTRADSDPDRVASAGADGTVSIWDPTTGEPLASVAITRFGAILALAWVDQIFGPALAVACEDGSISLLDVATLEELEKRELAGGLQCMTGLEGPTSGVAVGLQNGQIAQFTGSSLLSGEPVIWHGHNGEVSALASLSLEGRPILLSGGTDRSLAIWDVATGTEMSRIRLDGVVRSLDAAASSCVVGTSAGATVVRLVERSLRYATG
jgi:WD40 repeat protein